jgi:myo-inositol-1(or 4)-monophosphatase
MTSLGDLLRVAHEAVSAAAELARSSPPGALTPKGDRDFASEVDFTIERAVRDLLGQRTPTIAFVGEEENRAGANASEWWTLDPIDGTVNFAHDVPLFAVSLALIRDRRPVLGVIGLPATGARYWAAHGLGAHRDHHALRVRDVDQLDKAVIAIGDYAVGPGADDKNRIRLNVTGLLAGRALRVRMLGSAAIDLAWLAEGRFDASVTLSNRSWDVAAGVILAREAGAVVVDRDGSEHTTDSVVTIATASGIRDDLLDLIQTASTTEEHPPPAPSRRQPGGDG